MLDTLNLAINKTLESRKDQLQKQLIEALNANDTDLYTLLKSQWAHRFGVESLEELKNLDLNQASQNSNNEDAQEINQSQDSFIEVDKEISIKDDENQYKEIKNETENLVKPVDFEKKGSLESKSYEIVATEKNKNISTNLVREYKNPPKVEALIPLPPKPKYSYLRKWLLRS